MHGAKRNLAVLFTGQALLGAQGAAHIIVGGLAGQLLAPSAALATLPISIVVLAAMFTAPAASLYMGRFGRRVGFVTGALVGAAGAAVAMLAVITGDFSRLLLGSALLGVAQSFQGFFRFAAAETVSVRDTPKAISWVLAGGLVSALLGPELVRQFADALDPVPFAGAYAAVLVTDLVAAVALLALRIPRAANSVGGAASGRPLLKIFRQSTALGALLCGMISYAVMSLVMTSTPLAMVGHGFTADHAADVVRWHVVAMFGPSFFTGAVIARFGHSRVIAIGLVLLALCALIALSGMNLHQFYVALIALGIGWNFGFIGATSLLATTYTAAEQAKVQGVNDFLVFGLVSVASFSSGALLNSLGWRAVQLAALPALAVAGLTLLWVALSRIEASGGAD